MTLDLTPDLVPPSQSILATLNLDRTAIRSVRPPWRRTAYQAIFNWLSQYRCLSSTSQLEQVRGYLEALSLLCDLEDWAKAETILTIPLNAPTHDPLHRQLFRWGYYREQIELYQRLLHQVDDSLDAICLDGLGNAFDRLGHYQQAIVYHQQCLELAHQTAHREMQGKALCNLGNVYVSLHQYEPAAQCYLQSLTIAQMTGDRQAEGHALGNLGNLYRIQGNHAQALELLKQRLTIAQTIADRQGEGDTLGNLGAVYQQLQDYEQAMVCQQQSLAIARQLGNRAGEACALGNLGWLYEILGQVNRAIECWEIVQSISQVTGDRETLQTTIRQLGQLYQSIGNYEKAITILRQDLALAWAEGDHLKVGTILLNLSTATQASGNSDQAETWYQELLELSQNMDEGEGEKWVLAAMALYGLAKLHQLSGNSHLAIDYCDRVLQLNHAAIAPIVERCAGLQQELLNALHGS